METEKQLLLAGIDQLSVLLPGYQVSLKDAPASKRYDAVMQLERGSDCVELSMEVKSSGKQIVVIMLKEEIASRIRTRARP